MGHTGLNRWSCKMLKALRTTETVVELNLEIKIAISKVIWGFYVPWI